MRWRTIRPLQEISPRPEFPLDRIARTPAMPVPHDGQQWIRQAVDRFEGPLTLYAARLLGGDVERARDVVQDTFLRLWESDRASVDGHLAQWLYRVCRNRALDVRRKERRMTTTLEAAEVR